MKLQYSNSEFEEKGNAEEGQSKRGRKKRLNEFCEKFWDTTKRNTATICFAAGAALAVQNCGGNVHEKEDADSTEILEENN
ncbi:MAG: hypothetical protein QXT45_03370, partial [Candidatus Bilamarchaeaceae archaeon]